MTPRPFTIRPDDTVSLATQILVWNGIRHLPIVEGSRLVGILSERDILRHRAVYPSDHPMSTEVQEAMTAPAKTVHPDTPLSDAAEMMATNRIGCLLVVENDRLCGIVTATDLLAEESRSNFRRLFVSNDLVGATAEELMTPSAITADPDELVESAVSRMVLAGVHQLPVIEHGRLVGMLRDSDVKLEGEDFSRFAKPHHYRSIRVSTLMDANVATVRPSCPIADLARAFAEWRLHALPVVAESGALLGIVSYVDVLRSIASTGPEMRHAS